MKKITTEVYREYLENRLQELQSWADYEPILPEDRKVKLKTREQMDYVMFQLYRIDSAEQEE